MYGAGSRIAKKLFPHAVHLHDEPNPGFRGIPPEPIGKNLTALCQRINEDENLHFGLANDGDADRIGLVDEKGNFVDAHHIMLLVLYYLVEIKKQKGPVILSAATSEKVGHLAKSYGLEHEFTKIGFKHITPRFIDRQAIMGGEEAGGVAVAGHIPERDGIWAALIVMELMQHSGQSLGQLIQMIYEKVGPFVYDRMDLHLDERQKTAIVRKCQEDAFTHIADYPVRERILVDGYKYYLGEACWLMIRPSGTEPVLRIYAQAQTGRELHTLLKKSKAFLSGIKE
jgi:phosphomannomutase